MSVLKTAFGVVVVLAFAVSAVAEEPAAPQLTPEHKALESWLGHWSGHGELKPGPWGEGGDMTWTEECSFFEGSHFHVVCRSEGNGPMGPMKGLGIIGYNPEKGVYTHYGVDSSGWSGYSEGKHEGQTWKFKSQEIMGGKTYHTRFKMVMGDSGEMDFSWEMSEDGSEWTVLMDGKSTRK
jgi:hypothetical protein